MSTPPPVIRRIEIGGLSAHELLQRLSDTGVHMNDAALEIFAHEKFATSAARSSLVTVE